MFSQKYLCCGSHTNQRPQRGSPRHARDGRAHGATSARVGLLKALTWSHGRQPPPKAAKTEPDWTVAIVQTRG